mgnify:CR=1 FL=1
MHWVFLILSLYSQVSQIPLFPYIPSLFSVTGALVTHKLITVMNEEKEGEKEKISHTLLHSHTARALCPDSEKMREKRKERERKRNGQN